jgi:hypothetical protein
MRGAKQLMSSDSTTADPSQSPSRRFPNETSTDRLRLKTEMPGSPVERKRTYSGDFPTRDSLSRLSSSTGLPLSRAEAEGGSLFAVWRLFVYFKRGS